MRWEKTIIGRVVKVAPAPKLEFTDASGKKYDAGELLLELLLAAGADGGDSVEISITRIRKPEQGESDEQPSGNDR